MPAVDGTRLRYDELATRAIERTVNGVTIRVAALDDIIASKVWADRPKDCSALPELHRLSRAARNARLAAECKPGRGPPRRKPQAIGR